MPAKIAIAGEEQQEKTDNFTPLCRNPELLEHVSEVTRMLKALSHEQRLLIVCILTEGTKTVRELELATGLNQSVVSQHLARLRSANIVCTRREGKSVYYYIAGKTIMEVIYLLRERYSYNRSMTPKDLEVLHSLGRKDIFLET